MLKGSGKAYRRARELRRELTLPEVLLWQRLRGRAIDQHWRKQHPAGPYSLDFYCDVAKLCIEVDGEAHERGDRPDRDAKRDAWLAVHGITTLRIPAAEVLGNLEGVVRLVTEHARKRAPLHRPSDGPPPPAELGED
ncbi:endonuclease domain-containing protein [Sphingomonas sp. dw_22]|uniref:endonuclease domain-containing protein n=1 Tax=Sphingomonas sp. dw_22 TaxID=2721175 RepID=UPI001BD2E235|nr:endonuclease domain-containing protein [Sphingomonas sp. dw_22]